MTIMLARDSTNDRANEAKGDVIITDVIMAHRLFLGHFLIIMIISDYGNGNNRICGFKRNSSTMYHSYILQIRYKEIMDL